MFGRRQYVTSHTNNDPDITNYADALNQVKYAYNDPGVIDREYQALK